MWRRLLRQSPRLPGPVSVLIGTGGVSISTGLLDRKPLTCSDLHQVNRPAQLAKQAEARGKATSFDQEGKPNVVTVCLTGGPCGGKSSCLKALQAEATMRGVKVVLVPEIATVIQNTGYVITEDTAFNFQTQVAYLQYHFEAAMIDLVKATGQPTIVILDRGILDGKAYVDDGQWKKILGKATDGGKLTTEEEWLKKYDLILHLQTSAHGAEKYYKQGRTKDDSGNDVFRRETPKQARNIDDKLRDVYKDKHQNHQLITNDETGETGMKEKVAKAIDAVLEMAEKILPQTVEASSSGQI